MRLRQRGYKAGGAPGIPGVKPVSRSPNAAVQFPKMGKGNKRGRQAGRWRSAGVADSIDQARVKHRRARYPRVGGNMAEFTELRRTFREHGVDLISVSESDWLRSFERQLAEVNGTLEEEPAG